jgi:hypothetical protein
MKTMNTVTITREFSGFQNIADKMLVGSHGDVAGTEAEYDLPAGYSVADENIYDNHGFECFIEPVANGVRLISKAGPACDVFMASL